MANNTAQPSASSRKKIEKEGKEITLTNEAILAFQREIDRLRQDNYITYLEAITEYCEIHMIELETISSLINPNMKAKIYREAESFSLVKAETVSVLDLYDNDDPSS